MATFSYEQDAAEYQDGTPGVNPNAFVNVDASPIKDQLEAVERAEKECTIEYNATSEYYDSETEMWRIDFYTAERDENGRLIALLGNSQSVYLNSDGITQLIVYGE